MVAEQTPGITQAHAKDALRPSLRLLLFQRVFLLQWGKWNQMGNGLLNGESKTTFLIYVEEITNQISK